MKTSIIILVIVVVIYVIICILLYSYQEHLIFFPQKLSENHQFQFNQKFEEITIETDDKIKLNGVLFKADPSKGLIFYLHGNAGSIDSWGNIAQTYTDMNYDLFMLDYRGYGKSEGEIKSEKQFYSDVQKSYNKLKLSYNEKDIIVLGYSIGTASAARLASTNNPRILILQAPYYSLTDLMQHNYPTIPSAILKYKFETFEFIKNTTIPITIFHGKRDKVIYYGSSLKLKKYLKANDKLITLQKQAHNNMSDNPQYQIELKYVLQ